jgi:hypothetical protein
MLGGAALDVIDLFGELEILAADALFCAARA